MRAVVTRVLSARVLVDGEVVGELARPGVLALVGVSTKDAEKDAAYIARKIAELRILPASYAAGSGTGAGTGTGTGTGLAGSKALPGGGVGSAEPCLDAVAGSEDGVTLAGQTSPADGPAAEPEEDVSALDVGAPVLVVSQFTLHGATRKGRRPSWSAAARGDLAEPMVERVKDLLRGHGLHVESGRFGAMMQVESVNDGPFTLILDSTDPRR